jgi:hypothetical protein
VTTAATELAAARRQLHDSLIYLPISQATRAREQIRAFEAAVAATTREQVAGDIEQLLLPATNDAAQLRNGGIEHAARVAREGVTPVTASWATDSDLNPLRQYAIAHAGRAYDPTTDERKARGRLNRYRDMWPDAELVTRTIDYGPWEQQ